MKQEFKKKVLNWIKENGIDIGDKKVRVYDSRRYGLEVRIYNGSMEFPNTKKSHRKKPDFEGLDGKVYNSTYGIHYTTINTYTHINESDFKNEGEKYFILDMLKNG